MSLTATDRRVPALASARVALVCLLTAATVALSLTGVTGPRPIRSAPRQSPITEARPHDSQHPREGQCVRVTLLCGLTGLAVALYLAQLADVDLGATTGLGLISVLPVSTLLGIGFLTVAYVGSLALPRRCRWLLCSQLTLLVFMLHGITMLLESEPRFAISWVHSGFVEYIERTGTTAPGLDARWSWPGFFGLSAFWIGSGDRSALHPILTMMPIALNLLYLVALGLLASALRISWQAKWLALLFYCELNWIGQDYFSPQGWALLLYLFFIAFLVLWFRTPDPTAGRIPAPVRRAAALWRRLWLNPSRGELPARETGAAERIVVLAVLVGMFAAITFSHQLTPFAVLASATGLVLARRCTLTGLPVILIVILLGWISYMTQAYWGGNFNAVMSGVGNVGGTVSANIGDRAARGDAAHLWVVRIRMVTTVLVFLVAGIGLLRRRRRGIEDRVLLVLTAAPVGLAFMQSYGGEMALRVYLFALAPACLLAAMAFFPDPESRPPVLARWIAGGCALVMVFSFLVTRYGNEAFERISDGAVAAAASIYDNTAGSIKFVYVTAEPDLNSTPFMPLGYRDVERVSWTNTMAPIDPSDVADVLQALRDQGPGAYLITTQSQEAYIRFGQGYPTGWGEQLRHALADSPGVRTVVENPDAVVFTLDWPPGTPPKPDPPPSTGLQVWLTPWTPVGAGFLALLLGILGGREALRIRLTPGEHRRLRPLTLASIPLLVAFVLVVLERFMLLTS